jgi:hypothetical protein
VEWLIVAVINCKSSQCSQPFDRILVLDILNGRKRVNEELSRQPSKSFYVFRGWPMGREHRRNCAVRESYVCQPIVEIKEYILFDEILVNVMQAEDAMEIRFELREDMTLWARREEELHGKIDTHGKEFLLEHWHIRRAHQRQAREVELFVD